MKIKVDFVTNSSSEVFGVVAGSSAIVGALMISIEAMFRACREASQDDQEGEQSGGGSGSGGSGAETKEAPADIEDIAKTIAQAAVEDAKRQADIVKDAYNEAENTLDAAKNALEGELKEYKQAWEDSEKTADKTDPGYDNLKKQYEEYMGYLESQIRNTEYEKQIIAQEKAQKIADFESKNEWVKQRQADYIAVKEEKAMLEAVAKGYNVPGYNTDAVKTRLEQLKQRESELSKTLAENDASIDYEAQDRGEIGPSQESRELTNKIRAEREAYEKAVKTANAAKKKELEAQMEKNIAEYKTQMKTSDRFDMALKAAEGVQFGADVAVEGLSYVTGPAGQKIKLAYKSGKAMASGMGEGMADPKNASKHLAKGILNAGTEIVKDKFGDDNPWQQAATGILNEGLQGALDASIEGKDLTDAFGKGLTKGVFDSGVDKGLDILKGKLPIPKGSSVDVGDYSMGKILNNNPLTKGLAKTTVREGLGGQLKDAIKDEVVEGVGKEAGFVDLE